jgi:hypothetical protein
MRYISSNFAPPLAYLLSRCDVTSEASYPTTASQKVGAKTALETWLLGSLANALDAVRQTVARTDGAPKAPAPAPSRKAPNVQMAAEDATPAATTHQIPALMPKLPAGACRRLRGR